MFAASAPQARPASRTTFGRHVRRAERAGEPGREQVERLWSGRHRRHPESGSQ
jgi:hypothetical protein